MRCSLLINKADIITEWPIWFPDHLLNQLTSLLYFEDFNEDMDDLDHGDGTPGTGQIRIAYQPFAVWLASFKKLEILSVSFIVEAKYYFEAVQKYPGVSAWQQLSKLSLTSLLLMPKTDRNETDTLLLTAATAIVRMPKLKLLELWYGRRGTACLFRYRISRDGIAEIFCAGTWELALQPRVLDAWTKVSHLRTGREIRVMEPRRIDSSLIRSHGDAIHHLGLLTEVVHPVSLREIRREARDWS